MTQDGVTVIVDPPTFGQLPLALTQNSLTLTTTVNALLAQQVLALTQNGVSLTTDQSLSLTGQSLTITQRGVSLSVGQNITLASQPLQGSLNFLSLNTGVNLSLTKQNLYTTLNSFRLWKEIDFIRQTQLTQVATVTSTTIYVTSTTQFGCSGTITIGSDIFTYTGKTATSFTGCALVGGAVESYPVGTAVYQSFSTGTYWEDIGFGGFVYGDNFAIAATPLCSIQPCPRIDKQPKQTWGTVDTTTPTTWNNIPT